MVGMWEVTRSGIQAGPHQPELNSVVINHLVYLYNEKNPISGLMAIIHIYMQIVDGQYL